MASAARVEKLKDKYPEWQPWLRVIEEVVAEAANSAWDSYVPAEPGPLHESAPLLAGATLSVQLSHIRQWINHLMGTAFRSGVPKAQGMAVTFDPKRLDAVALLQSSMRQDRDSLNKIGGEFQADPEAFHALAELVSIPLLQACGRRLGHWVRETWTHGYCPICGAWPALAEARGIERSRRMRCARCGGDWRFEWLRCPYCGATEHHDLVSLVPELNGEARKVDACRHCLGYVKTLSVLQPVSSLDLLVEDLETTDLDVSALRQGYNRPPPGYRIDCRILEKPGLGRRILSWRS